ncbi:BQ2448_6455 [Microbotryum intermedium]|uniref:BQ2448_6455 protein n=1 Tax=Microbotryum intermedium TaxID=269621 RepID=A0A238FPU0_9BASI|nr:BQ2448_6455 [Microbotryum intermedium]
MEKGDHDAFVIGIDPRTTCHPLAVSVTLFDRNENHIQDDFMVYAAALSDKPLKMIQTRIKTVSAHLARNLKFGLLKNKTATLSGNDFVQESATSTTSTVDGDAASGTAPARLVADSSSLLLLLGEPARQVWTTKSHLQAKGSEFRFVEQIMDLAGSPNRRNAMHALWTSQSCSKHLAIDRRGWEEPGHVRDAGQTGRSYSGTLDTGQHGLKLGYRTTECFTC